MRYQGISVDWTSSGPQLYYSQLEGEREDSGEKYYSNGFAYLPASLSKEEVTTKFIDRLLSELQEDGTRISRQIGQLKGLRPASEIKPSAHAPYFYYQDGQWFGYSNSVGGSPTRFGELVCDVDGYWKFFPAGGPGGYIPDFIMKAVLDKLGELNAVWDKQIESDPAIADHSNLEDALEAAFWNFDARCKGYSKYAGARVSERDAFKAEVRNLLYVALNLKNTEDFVRAVLSDEDRKLSSEQALARLEEAQKTPSGVRPVVAKTEAVGRSQIRSFRNKETPPSREQVLEKENEYLKACVARLEKLLFHKTYPKKL